jgi:two-component system, chemotaxis family, sensor kinase CheA
MSTLNWESIKETFFTESRENLDVMEESILALENGDNDSETINALFRSVHTIKGSSGMFGFDEVERFTHGVENMLQKLRNGSITINQDLLDTLMGCHDHIRKLLVHCEEHAESDAETLRRGNELAGLLDGAAVEPEIANLDSRENRPALWSISISPGGELFRHGIDPASLIAYIANAGEIRSIVTRFHEPAGSMDPETCYLGFEIVYDSTASLEDLRRYFEFIEDDCEVIITPFAEMPGNNGAPGAEEAISMHEKNADADNNRTPLKDESAGPGAAGDTTEKHSSSVIRMKSEKIDRLLNHVGELVISNATMAQLARGKVGTDLDDSLENMSRLIENIRESTMNMRVVPIGEIFTRFNRVVRDLSRELGKEIDFTVEGGETEIDKSIMDMIVDPLMHMIRNSIDHGIEPSGERNSLGKPSSGMIRLKAYQEAGLLVIECSDDGRGLDSEKILLRARAQGLLPADAEVPEHEIHQVIFKAGFSTKEDVTNLSGRGVGMDVVRKNVESLRGSISIKSEKGKGALFRIELPLTLAIIEGFIVEIGSSKYIIPLYSVTECNDIDPRDLHDDEGCSYIDLRGEVLPFIRLNELFGGGQEDTGKLNIVVVEHAKRRVGLVVRKFIGENQTVVKPLGRLFSRHPWISGFTMLGTGEIAMILDVGKLLQNFRIMAAAPKFAMQTNQMPAEASLTVQNYQ